MHITKQHRVCSPRCKSLIAVAVGLAILPPMVLYKQALAPGTHVETPLCAVDEAHLLIDETGWNPETQKRVIRQEIFDEMLATIDQSENLLIIDLFLWNSWQGKVPETYRDLSGELTEALIARKKARPQLTVLVLTDPINRAYGTGKPAHFSKLAQNGIPVVFTDLERLRDSRNYYAKFMRLYGGPISHLPGLKQLFNISWICNPFDQSAEALSLRDAARLFFFKANHRKVLICDEADGWHMICASLNPANGSSAHSNLGVHLRGDLARLTGLAELEALTWSASKPVQVIPSKEASISELLQTAQHRLSTTFPAIENQKERAQWLTEAAIRQRLIDMLGAAQKGDKVRAAIFYLSDRGVVQALKQAALRGAQVRIIIDPNKDAFGRYKDGVPNRPVANELHAYAEAHQLALTVRWASTHGEQFHGKALGIYPSDGHTNPALLLGSANWTRRNLQDFNMEGDIYIEAEAVTDRYAQWFERIWSNADDLEYTVDYARWHESALKRWYKWLSYRYKEHSGSGTF